MPKTMPKKNKSFERRNERLREGRKKSPFSNTMMLMEWQERMRQKAAERDAMAAYEKVIRDMEHYAKQKEDRERK